MSTEVENRKPKIISTTSKSLSQWVTLNERSIMWGCDGSIEVFHSLSLADYVTVLALTKDSKVVLVRQYRPAIQSDSIELPGGMLDDGEAPAICAERELFEETGYRLKSPLIELGCLTPDVGRLENRLWGYLANDIEYDSAWKPEIGVDPLILDFDEFKSFVFDGGFNNAFHIALVGLAVMRGLV